MSEVTSRPRVRQVSAATLAASVLGAGVVRLSGAALRQLVARVDPILAQQLQRTSSPASPIVAVTAARRAQLAAERAVLASSVSPQSPLQTFKLSVLAGLDAAGYVDVHGAASRSLRALLEAPTLREAVEARRQLVPALEASQLQALSAAVVQACVESCRQIAFDQIAVDTAGTLTRVTALDRAGRALVSEVSVAGHDVRVETEVVGVLDGSCHHILDQFDAAMAAHGVDAVPSRRPTGGTCQLAAARRLAERLDKVPSVRTSGPDAVHRRRRLNATARRTAKLRE